MLLPLAISIFSLTSYVQAHGTHEQIPIPPDADWATRHMIEEHHIANFDAASFFSLHDYDSSGEWTPEDLYKTYGLKDESNAQTADWTKEKAIKGVIALFDKDNSGTISRNEFVEGDRNGIKLPDLGYGPGHHGDDEYEYEIHHFEIYHDENTKEEDLIHPEDIEHFRKHEELEMRQEAQEQMDRMKIVEANIPSKFRRS